MSTAPPTSGAGDDGQAETWLARLRAPDCSARDRAAFEDWLAQSPAHIEAWLESERIDAMARMLASDDLLRAAARRARRSTGNGGTLRRWWPTSAAIAATLAVAFGAAFWLMRPAPVTVTQYATAIGEQRSVVLADGTAVLIDTDSALTTHFSRDARRVELQRGRAQFVVGADPQRPFTVEAGAATVRDIGTTFQVSRRGGEVDVGLLDGAVIVTVDDAAGAAQRSTLAPGQQVTVDAAGSLQSTRALDLAVAEAWPRGDLVFKNRRLDSLLAEMNRYSDTQLQLADPDLGGITVSGVFDIDDQPALVAALEQGWSLRAERAGEQIVLHGPVR